MLRVLSVDNWSDEAAESRYFNVQKSTRNGLIISTLKCCPSLCVDYWSDAAAESRYFNVQKSTRNGLIISTLKMLPSFLALIIGATGYCKVRTIQTKAARLVSPIGPHYFIGLERIIGLPLCRRDKGSSYHRGTSPLWHIRTHQDLQNDLCNGRPNLL
jgi:hypothetical protein